MGLERIYPAPHRIQLASFEQPHLGYFRNALSACYFQERRCLFPKIGHRMMISHLL
jgi:hypothetical protein